MTFWRFAISISPVINAFTWCQLSAGTTAANQVCQATDKVTRNHFPHSMWSMHILSRNPQKRSTGQQGSNVEQHRGGEHKWELNWQPGASFKQWLHRPISDWSSSFHVLLLLLLLVSSELVCLGRKNASRLFLPHPPKPENCPLNGNSIHKKTGMTRTC